MDLPVKLLTPTAKLPTYAHATDAGMDVYSDTDLVIPAGERALVSTGIAIAVPAGHVALGWDKSGIATKTGLTTLAGVIDAGYRGEVKIAVLNTGKEPYVVKAGEKIAQLLIQPIDHSTVTAVTNLPDADRGEHGFGSTGL